jgi:hypothetical protein
MPYKDPDKRREATKIRMRIFRERHKDDKKYLERKRELNRESWYRNKDKRLSEHKEWYQKNREAQLLKMRKYYHHPENKSRLNELKKESNKLRRKVDNNFLIKSRLRCLLYNSLKLYGEGKRFSSSKYGIDFNLICKKLGPCPGKREEWDIDHIIPCSSFDLNKVDEVRKCFSPNNLQWLPKLVNIKKSNKITSKNLQQLV